MHLHGQCFLTKELEPISNDFSSVIIAILRQMDENLVNLNDINMADLGCEDSTYDFVERSEKLS